MNEISATKWNDDEPGCEFRINGYEERGDRIQREVIWEKLGVEVGSAESWKLMRAMSGGERFALGANMTRRFFAEVRAEIVAEHPTWNETERKIAFVARMYGPTLADHFRRSLEERRTFKETDEHSD